MYQLTHATRKKATYGFIQKFENGAEGQKGRVRMLAYLDISPSARLSQRCLTQRPSPWRRANASTGKLRAPTGGCRVHCCGAVINEKAIRRGYMPEQEQRGCSKTNRYLLWMASCARPSGRVDAQMIQIEPKERPAWANVPKAGELCSSTSWPLAVTADSKWEIVITERASQVGLGPGPSYTEGEFGCPLMTIRRG